MTELDERMMKLLSTHYVRVRKDCDSLNKAHALDCLSFVHLLGHFRFQSCFESSFRRW